MSGYLSKAWFLPWFVPGAVMCGPNYLPRDRHNWELTRLAASGFIVGSPVAKCYECMAEANFSHRH